MDTINKMTVQQQRRKRSNDKIKAMGIACLESLPVIEKAEDVRLKTVHEICLRAAACMFSIQMAFDIMASEDYQESTKFFMGLIDNFSAGNALNEKEKRMFNNEFSQQDVLDMTWAYESYWAIVWAAGLIDDMGEPFDACDCNKAIEIIRDCGDLAELESKCRLRDVNEILDMLDLYYRYHWACVNKTVNPDTPVGKLDYGVVMERRRGLEWLIAQQDDWYEISLDT